MGAFSKAFGLVQQGSQLKQFYDYKDRVLLDGGVFYDTTYVGLKRLIRDNNTYGATLRMCLNPALGAVKLRTSGVYNFATKSYDIAPHSPQLGSELVVNGDFSNGSTGWTAVGSSLLVVDGFLRVTNNVAGAGYAYQSVALMANITYYFKCNGKVGNTGVPSMALLSSPGGDFSINIIAGGSGFQEFSYTPTSNTIFYIGVGNRGSSFIGTYNDFDNVSVKIQYVNDATQTIATNQPYLSKIAPIEKPALLNPNGDDCYMTHPTISFGASDPWSIEVVLNGNAGNSENGVIASDGSSNNLILLNHNAYGRKVSLRLNGVFYTFSNYLLNETLSKNTIFLIIKIGSFLYLYVDGILKDAISSVNNNVVLSTLYYGTSQSGNFNGKLYHYAIFSKALSASEVANRAALLRSIYPEIESVTIGTQTWAVRNYDAVCTPQGNLIPEVQSATNTEKITNAADREFSSDTGFWNKQTGWSIADGVAHAISVPTNNSLYKPAILETQKWYKFTYTVSNYSSGGVKVNAGNGFSSPTYTSNGTYTNYVQCGSGAQIYFVSAGTTTLDLDNVSVQEVGWSDATNLYNYVYANTTGTVEQKTYAAVKAAAMWCHYNNDPANGAIYSKLYNWFAVKLLQMDIDYYNAANPTTPWGWRVPTQTDFTTLQTYLGGASVAGGKLKMIGTGYWNSPNTGATNETGFSALGGGVRLESGGFAGNLTSFPSINSSTSRYNLRYSISDFETGAPIDARYGFSLRLIKQ